MPVHHLLEQILNEYIESAGLQSGQPLFQSVNSLGTAVTGRALQPLQCLGGYQEAAKAAVFSPPSDVTPGGQPASRSIWRTTDDWNTRSRWPAMSLRERPSFTIGQRTKLHSAR